MAIKHDAILAYYECGPLIITLWPNKETYNFDQNAEITIARELNDVYKKPIDVAKLIPKLETESLEKVLELTNTLTKSEIENLEKEKQDIIKYLKTAVKAI